MNGSFAVATPATKEQAEGNLCGCHDAVNAKSKIQAQTTLPMQPVHIRASMFRMRVSRQLLAHLLEQANGGGSSDIQ